MKVHLVEGRLIEGQLSHHCAQIAAVTLSMVHLPCLNLLWGLLSFSTPPLPQVVVVLVKMFSCGSAGLAAAPRVPVGSPGVLGVKQPIHRADRPGSSMKIPRRHLRGDNPGDRAKSTAHIFHSLAKLINH